MKNIEKILEELLNKGEIKVYPGGMVPNPGGIVPNLGGECILPISLVNKLKEGCDVSHETNLDEIIDDLYSICHGLLDRMQDDEIILIDEIEAINEVILKLKEFAKKRGNENENKN